jgi:hypothetical protein
MTNRGSQVSWPSYVKTLPKTAFVGKVPLSI